VGRDCPTRARSGNLRPSEGRFAVNSGSKRRAELALANYPCGSKASGGTLWAQDVDGWCLCDRDPLW
jgi:hypothetical protein